MNEESPKVLNYNNLSNKEITKEVLENLINFNLSSLQIARQLKCNPVYIKRLLKKFKLKTNDVKRKIEQFRIEEEREKKLRVKAPKIKVVDAKPIEYQPVKRDPKTGKFKPKRTDITKEMLSAYTEKGVSSYIIANNIGVPVSTVKFWLKKFQLKIVPCSGKNCLPNGIISKNEEENTHYKCARCKEIQLISKENFYFKKDSKVHSWCRKCNDKYALHKIRDVKLRCVQYKGGKCTVCSYSKYIGALEFHHIDPSAKDYNISKLRSYCWENIKKELKKCVLLCSNCHREFHAGLIKLE